MKKRITSFVLVLTMIVLGAFSSIAGTKNNIAIKDIKRLQEVMTKVTGKKCTVINYQQINSSEWMIRVEGEETSTAYSKYSGDYRVKFVDNEPDVNSEISNCWFYAGVYDDTFQHNLHGFVVATREYRKLLNQYYTYSQADDYAILESK